MEIDYVRHYKRFHSTDDAHYVQMQEFYIPLLNPILKGMPKEARILDIGCGMGLLVNALIKEGFHDTSGIDLSSGMIDLAEQKNLPCTKVDENGVYDRADREPGSLDAIFLVDVLEHIRVDQQISFVNAIFRLLSKNGVLVSVVPNANSPVAARYRYIDWTHTSAFTEHSLHFLMASAGFESLDFLPYSVSAPTSFPHINQPRFWTKQLRHLTRSFRRLEMIGELGRQGFSIPLDVNLLAVARKA